jgi:hypothetical protein
MSSSLVYLYLNQSKHVCLELSVFCMFRVAVVLFESCIQSLQSQSSWYRVSWILVWWIYKSEVGWAKSQSLDKLLGPSSFTMQDYTLWSITLGFSRAALKQSLYKVRICCWRPDRFIGPGIICSKYGIESNWKRVWQTPPRFINISTEDFKLRFDYKNILFARRILLLLLPLVITFLPHCHYFLLHDDKRTSERVNERTSGNFSLLTSWSSFAYHY